MGDPLPGVGALNRQCFCAGVNDVAPLLLTSASPLPSATATAVHDVAFSSTAAPTAESPASTSAVEPSLNQNHSGMKKIIRLVVPIAVTILIVVLCAGYRKKLSATIGVGRRVSFRRAAKAKTNTSQSMCKQWDHELGLKPSTLGALSGMEEEEEKTREENAPSQQRKTKAVGEGRTVAVEPSVFSTTGEAYAT